MTKSAVTRENYARSPQAVLDVLEFYTEQQKREGEELGLYPNSYPGTSGNTLSPSTLSLYPQTSSAPRFSAGMSLGGIGSTSLDSRSPLPQLPTTISPVTTNFQANRPAPPRPLLTANRPAPPAPRQKAPLQDYTTSSAELLARTKAQGPSIDHSQNPGLGTDPPPVRKESMSEGVHELQERKLRKFKLQELERRERRPRGRERRERELRELERQEREQRERKLQERERERERERDLEHEQREKEGRPQIATSKSSPATTNPVTYPILGPVTDPPPVKPLQLVKNTPTPAVTVTQPEEDGAIEATAAALWINDLPVREQEHTFTGISTSAEEQQPRTLREGKDTGLPPSPPLESGRPRPQKARSRWIPQVAKHQ